MNNIIIKITAPELCKLVQDHINKSLAGSVRAQATNLSANYASEAEPNVPNLQIMATVNIIAVD